MSMISGAAPQDQREFTQHVKMMTAAAPPPASVIASIEAMGISITHGLRTDRSLWPRCGACAEKPSWRELSVDDRANLKARQGVAYELEEDVRVLNPETGQPVPWDGQTLGEIVFRGNIVMKGYLKEPEETAKAFKDGWFWSGDIAVHHSDGLY